jgi:tRNA C32,U32 (ribose-2'-O)-methylase TrmJ
LARAPHRCAAQLAIDALASATEMERFYEHLAQVLEDIDFRDRTGEGYLLRGCAACSTAPCLDQNEVNILSGILTAVQGRRRRAGEPITQIPGETR